jgi:hypothetical protein
VIVVIDDERNFDLGEQIYYIRTSQEAISRISHHAMMWETSPVGAFEPIRELWLDHDLGLASDNDGDVVATFLVLMMRAQPEMFEGCKIYIHSQNPVGAARIEHIFSRNDIEAKRVELPALIQKTPS